MFVGNDFVFIHIPKNAGTSLRAFLADCGLGHSLQKWHTPVHEMSNEYRRKKRIAVIRNPLDYYISLYEYQRKKPERVNDRWYNFWSPRGTFKEFIEASFSDGDTNTKMDLGLGKNPNRPVFKWMKDLDVGYYTVCYIYMCFERYREIFDDPRLVFDNHNELISIDKMLRCENLAEEVGATFGLSKEQERQFSERPRKNVTDKSSIPYYDSELVQAVMHKDRLIFNNYYPEQDEHILR